MKQLFQYFEGVFQRIFTLGSIPRYLTHHRVLTWSFWLLLELKFKLVDILTIYAMPIILYNLIWSVTTPCIIYNRELRLRCTI
jgi:hypothetical protein